MKTFTSLLCLVLVCFESAISDPEFHFGDDDYINFSKLMVTENTKILDPQFEDFQVTDISVYPYHVAIVSLNEETDQLQLVCQGVLVSFDWILTSASCIWPKSETLKPATTFAIMGTVDYKSSQATTRKLSYFVFHPLFDTTTGKGNDVALWMLATSAAKNSGIEKIVLLEENPEAPTPSKCVYSTYKGNILTRNFATLKKNDSCEEIGILANNGYCVIMNNFLSKKRELYELGCPLVCDNKLYGLRTANGRFTTVVDIFPWVIRVIKMGSTLNKNGADGVSLKKNPRKENEQVIRNPRTGSEEVVRYAREFPTEKPTSQENKMTRKPFTSEEELSPWMSGLWNIAKHNLRRRRALKMGDHTEIEHMFLSWARSVVKMSKKRQVWLKVTISKLVTDSELDEIAEQESERRNREIEEETKKQQESIAKQIEAFQHNVPNN